VKRALERSSLATLLALVPHYLAFYLFSSPLWTETIGEWIMARTPSQYALWLLGNLGPLAKPFAITGGLATLGAAVLVLACVSSRWLRWILAAGVSGALGWWFGYTSLVGQASFWLPAMLALSWKRTPAPSRVGRRHAMVMIAGTVFVAAESFIREETMSRRAAAPRELAPFEPPAETFAPGLVRKAVTPVDTFYVMSKNTVDPALDVGDWKLRITVDGKTARVLSYGDLLAMPAASEYVTLRCISNTLQSDLMGTALWTGVRLRQLISLASLPKDVVEAAVIGVDGHGDSFAPQYLFSDDVLLAIGMNGKTLTRAHGFPVRLIVPRYYGFKNVKWIGEIAFVKKPYFGTWPKMGYTKEPLVHTASHIDRIRRDGSLVKAGGVSFAGDRGIGAVQVRAEAGAWVDASIETPLSRFTWTRWHAEVPAGAAGQWLEARAMDGSGRWQEAEEGPLFPDGVKGPTVRRIG